jgi:cytochrome c biogenesis factor
LCLRPKVCRQLREGIVIFMEKIMKLLHMAFNVIIFFIAISLLYSMHHSFVSFTDRTADVIAVDDTLYETYLESEEHYASQEEIITLLLDKLEYDMEVEDEMGNYTIHADRYNPSEIGLYIIKSKMFEKSYTYNQNGSIAKIKYRSISE